jgi:hypothetical protein
MQFKIFKHIKILECNILGETCHYYLKYNQHGLFIDSNTKESRMSLSTQILNWESYDLSKTNWMWLINVCYDWFKEHIGLFILW